MKKILTAEQKIRLYELGIANVESLTDILSILPKKVSDRQRIYELEIWVDHYSDAWCVQYTHNSDVNKLEDSFQSAEELCDAIYEEIVWLKENPELVWL